jgi:hypothetical protein
MEILQQLQQQVTTTAKITHVLCPLNLNKNNWGKLTSTKNCSQQCIYFNGLVTYPDGIILPRLTCLGSGHPKMLELYTHCSNSKFNRSVRCEKFCKKCPSFIGIETSTGCVKCKRSTKEHTVSILPHRNLKCDYPFEIRCAKTQNLATVDTCLLCSFFKGIYGKGIGKVCCFHPQAIETQHLTCRRYKKYLIRKKNASPKSLKLPNLRWLFEERVEVFSLAVQTNCILNKTLKECRNCSDHKNIIEHSYRINCKIYLNKPILYINCCKHSKSPVSLQNCLKCQQNRGFEDDNIKCSWTRLQGYVFNAPKRLRKEKYYYDFGD